jgi:hypothetical protein
MRIKVYIFVILTLALLTMSGAGQFRAESTSSREYRIKAAFLYNFIKFVEWPKEKTADSNEPIIIGIIGKDPFGNAFEPIKDKPVKGKKLIIKRFKGFEEPKKSGEKDEPNLHPKIEALRKCYLLFICSSEKKNLGKIINSVKDHSVLTVGDMEGFLESGGIINFVMEGKKVRFEINVTAAKRAKLKIRSQLLRLAKRVIEKEPSHEAKN